MPQSGDDLRHLLTTAGSGGAIGFLVGLARYIVTVEQGSVRAWLRGVVAAVLVGVLVAWGVDSVGWTTTLKALAIALGAYIAPSVLHAVVLLGQQMSTDPLSFARDVMASLRGGYRPPGPPQ